MDNYSKIPSEARIIIINDDDNKTYDIKECLDNITIRDDVDIEKVNFNSDVFYGVRNLVDRGKPLVSVCTNENNLVGLVETLLNKIEFQDYIGKIQLSASTKSLITEWLRNSEKDVLNEDLSGIIEIVELDKDDMSKILIVDKNPDKYFNILVDDNAETLAYKVSGEKGLLTNHIFLTIKNKIFDEPVKSELKIDSNGKLNEYLYTKFDDSESKNILKDLISEHKKSFIKSEITPLAAPRFVIESLQETDCSWMTLKIWEEIILDLIFMNENNIRLENYTSKDYKDKGVLEPVKDKFNEGLQNIKDKFSRRDKTDFEEDVKEGIEEFKNKISGPATTKIRDLFDLDKIKINKTQKFTDKVSTKRIKECRFIYLPDLNFKDDTKFLDILYSLQKYDEKLFDPNSVVPLLTKLENNRDEIYQIINKSRVAVNYKPEYFDYISNYGNIILNRIDTLNKFIKDEINRRIKLEERIKQEEKAKKRNAEKDLAIKLADLEEQKENVGSEYIDNEVLEDNVVNTGEIKDKHKTSDNNFDDTIILNPSEIETNSNNPEA